jgi:hypothetical protein
MLTDRIISYCYKNIDMIKSKPKQFQFINCIRRNGLSADYPDSPVKLMKLRSIYLGEKAYVFYLDFHPPAFVRLYLKKRNQR